MNYRMTKTWGVLANVIWEDHILCNNYRIQVHWTSATDDNLQQNIAFNRVKYWLFDVMEHSLLISKDHDRLALYQATGQRVIELPETPIDPMIAMMLFTKFSAITEGRMTFTEVMVSSEQGEHVQYLQGSDEDFMTFAEAGWWQDPGPAWSHAKPGRGNKVVNLSRMPEWAELDLSWDNTDHKSDGSVVFAEFKKNAD